MCSAQLVCVCHVHSVDTSLCSPLLSPLLTSALSLSATWIYPPPPSLFPLYSPRYNKAGMCQIFFFFFLLPRAQKKKKILIALSSRFQYLWLISILVFSLNQHCTAKPQTPINGMKFISSGEFTVLPLFFVFF